MDPFTVWVESLEAAYGLAKGERLNEINGVRVRTFDARGIHPFSAVWGAVEAIETLEPDLCVEHVQTSPAALRHAAREDADAEHREQGFRTSDELAKALAAMLFLPGRYRDRAEAVLREYGASRGIPVGERIPDCRYPGGPGCPNATPDGSCCMEVAA